MERLLLLWDELDDFARACRHWPPSAVEEVGAVSAPVTRRRLALVLLVAPAACRPFSGPLPSLIELDAARRA